jgi:hypothetical protein
MSGEIEPLIEIVCDSAKCTTCERLASNWLRPNDCVKVSGETVCVACYGIRHASAKHLGVSISDSKEASLRLCLLKGAGALISKKGRTLFAPGKHYEKFKSCTNTIFDNILDLSAVANENIEKVMELTNIEPPYMFISDFGNVPNKLISNLEVTGSTQVLINCSGDGVTRIKRKCVDFKSKIAGINKKDNDAIFNILKKRCIQPIGAKDRDTLFSFLDKYVFLNDFIESLPIDPHDQIYILNKVR